MTTADRPSLQQPGAASSTSAYDAFLSYSHSADGTFATELHHRIERFAAPWFRRRVLRVFRDDASLSANPHLWGSIEQALASSSWLVLLANPASAGSPWVAREVSWWLENRSVDRLLIVRTGGVIAWDEVRHDFDWDATSALPPALAHAFPDEPRWVEGTVDARRPLESVVADVAATLRGVPKDELLGEHLRQHRRTMRRAYTGITALAVLLVLALIATVVAVGARSQAAQQRDTAVFTKVVAQSDELRDTDSTMSAELALTAYRRTPTPELRARVLDRGNAALSRPLPAGPGWIRSVASQPNGSIVASGGDQGVVHLWDTSVTAAPRDVASFSVGSDVNAVAFRPDGRVLAAATADGVHLWNVTDPAHPSPDGPTLRGDPDGTNDVVWRPDGRVLVSADPDGGRLWSVADVEHPIVLGQPLLTQYGGASATAMSPDGATLAVNDGGSIRTWDVRDTAAPIELSPPWPAHALPVTALAFSPDGHTLASGSQDRTVRLWNLTDPHRPIAWGQPLAGHTDFVNDIAFSPDGQTLASAGGDRVTRLWTVADPSHPASQGQPLAGHELAVMATAFLPHGRRLATVGKDGMLRVWELPSTLMTGRTDYPGFYTNNVAIRSDGHLLAIGNADATVRLWDLTVPDRPAFLGELPRAHQLYVNALAFDPSGRILATGSDDRTIRLWDLTVPSRPAPVGGPLAVGHPPNSMTFTPDGRLLIVGDGAGGAHSWDVSAPATPTPVATWTAHDGKHSVNAVAIDPTGRTLVTAGGDYTVRLWDLADPMRPRQLGPPRADHTLFVNAAALTPGGRILATASADQTVRLTDLSDRAHPVPLGAPLSDAQNPLFAVAVSPDSRMIAAGGSDNQVRLWDTTDPERTVTVGPLSGHTDTVTGLAFTPDGGHLVSGGYDQTARIWDVDVERVAHRICTVSGGGLDQTQWARRVSPDVDYSQMCS